jgi:selenocysteine lyase/cysteine desulfurase
MLESQKNAFFLSDEVCYLNNAYMSPSLKSAEEAGIIGLQKKRFPYEIGMTDFFNPTEKIREEFGKIIHTTDYKRIVIIPSVSYGMATVAQNLKISAGQNIIVAGEQFPSNIYPWMKLCKENQAHLKIIDAPKENLHRGKIWNEQILDAINADTKMVALGHIHWADGTLFQLEEIRKRTREVGALLVIDGTQSVGALPFDIQKIQADALICASYKWLLGPYSIGLAYYGEYFDEGKPLEENWINRYESENLAGLVNYQEKYHEKALRYEVGEHSNFILIPMVLAALQQVNQWGVENIQEYCKNLTEAPVQIIREMGYQIEALEHRSSHLFGISLPNPRFVSSRNETEYSMEAIKSKFKEHDIHVSFRGEFIRIATYLFNDKRDMEKLIHCLS